MRHELPIDARGACSAESEVGMIGGDSEGSGTVARLTALGLSLLKKVDMVGVPAYRACVMHDEGRGEAKEKVTKTVHEERRGDEFSSNKRHGTSNVQVFGTGVSSFSLAADRRTSFTPRRVGNSGNDSSDNDSKRRPQSQQSIRRIEGTVGVTKSLCKFGFVSIAARIAFVWGT
jgi:hypothetical protein